MPKRVTTAPDVEMSARWLPSSAAVRALCNFLWKFVCLHKNYNCTKTDTGGLVEYTKANERTPPKELGQMAPYLRYEECHDTKWLSKERAATVY